MKKRRSKSENSSFSVFFSIFPDKKAGIFYFPAGSVSIRSYFLRFIR